MIAGRSNRSTRAKKPALPFARTVRITYSICSMSETRSRTIVRFSGLAARSAAASAAASLPASTR